MIKDRLRTLLNIRVKRESPVIGAKPKMGSKITLGGMRMFVTSTPPDQLWYFCSRAAPAANAKCAIGS